MARRTIIFALAALILLAAPFSLSARLRGAAASLFRPVALFFTAERGQAVDYVNNISSLGSLREERDQLQREVLELRQQLSDYEELKRENESLRQEVGVQGAAQDIPKVFARVVIQGTNLLDRRFIINVGSSQGVKTGQPVTVNGQLVGRIVEVQPESAQVRMITSRDSIIQAWFPTLNQFGILVGDGNTVRMEKVSQGIEVPENTLVETSGLGETLPQGVIIGTVGNRLSDPSESDQSFRVNLGYDPSSIQSVLVLMTDPL